MADPGESLSKLILPYPGRELLKGSKDQFFDLKSGIKSRYIYDLGLSTGEVLYESAGGMGISDNIRIIQLHDLIKKPYAEQLIKEEFENTFKGKWGKAKFYRVRRDTNQELKDPSRRTIAKLYCLLASSGFRYKFDKFGNFKGDYFPHSLDTSEIVLNNRKLINSDFLLKHGSYNSFDKNLLTKKSLVYFHVPFPWTKVKKDRLFDYFNSLSAEGTEFLVSGKLMHRGKVDAEMLSWSNNYSSIILPQFKEPSSHSSSDIFITNF